MWYSTRSAIWQLIDLMVYRLPADPQVITVQQEPIDSADELLTSNTHMHNHDTHTQVRSLAHCKAYIIFQIKECIVCCEEVRGGHLQRDSFHYIKCPPGFHPILPPQPKPLLSSNFTPWNTQPQRQKERGHPVFLERVLQLHTDGQQWAREGIDWADLTGKIKSSFCSKRLQTTCF